MLRAVAGLLHSKENKAKGPRRCVLDQALPDFCCVDTIQHKIFPSLKHVDYLTQSMVVHLRHGTWNLTQVTNDS